MVSGSPICADATTGSKAIPHRAARQSFLKTVFITLPSGKSIAGVTIGFDAQLDVFHAVDEVRHPGHRVSIHRGARDDQKPFGVPDGTADQVQVVAVSYTHLTL